MAFFVPYVPFVCAALAVAGPGAVSAQGAREAVAMAASPIVITASRLPQPLTEALPHTTVLTREDIEQAGVPDLGSLIAREAGLQLAANGGLGSATSIFMRGAPSRQVLLLIDGVPFVRQDATGSIPFEQLMLDRIDRVEIVRGNVSALYGSGAVGGVVQIFTRPLDEDGLRPSAALELGSRGTRRVSAGAQGRAGDTTWALGLAGVRTDGRSALDPATSAAVNPDRDGYENVTASGSLSHRIGPGHTLGALGWLSDGRTEYDSRFAAAVDVQRSATRLGLLQLTSDHRLGERWQGRLVLAAARDRQHFLETGAFGYEARYVVRTDSLQWQHTVDLDAAWRLTGGVEHQRQRLQGDDGFGSVDDHERSTDAVHAGVTGRVGAHQWQGHLRWDRIGGTGSKATGLLAWGLELAGGWGLRASLSNAFHAPPLGYLYYPFGGNRDLRPESARSVELGAQWSDLRPDEGQERLLRATLFATRVRDEIEYDTTTQAFGNVQRTRNRGLEVSASGRDRRWRWQASLTLQQPEDADTGEQRRRRSRTLASAGLERAVGPWHLGANARFASHRPDGAVTLGGYTVVDLTARHDLAALAPGLSMQLRVDNALDRAFATAAGYPQPGRGLFVGLRWAPR